jgi:hypothetical protein
MIERRSVMTYVGLMLMLIGSCGPAAAQDKVDVSVDYQVQHLFASGQTSENFPFGLNVDVAGRIAHNVSAVGQLDWSHKSESESTGGVTVTLNENRTTYAGGIRLSSVVNENVTPFLQALFGMHRVSASESAAGLGAQNAAITDPMLQVGGGVALAFSERIGAVAQFDYRRIFPQGGGLNSIRGVFGIRIMAR